MYQGKRLPNLADNVLYLFTQTNIIYLITYSQAHSQDVNCVKWNPKDSNLLASCSDDSTIKLWNVQVNL